MLRPILLIVLATAACQTAPTRFVGDVVGCGQTTRGLLDIQGKDFVLTPSEDLLTLHGHIAPDGTLQGQGALPGPAAPTIHFSGRLERDQITGTLTGGTCPRSVTLTPPKAGLERIIPAHSRQSDLRRSAIG
jgi:hypothetical protein